MEFVFEKQLNIVRNYGSSFDLTTNPLVISYGGYYQCGEHELFLGVIKNWIVKTIKIMNTKINGSESSYGGFLKN